MTIRQLLQVAVVVLLLVVVAGLLVTAVGKVREAARRFACTNNLRQVGLSVLMYADFNNRYPQAVMPNPDLPPEGRLSWLVAIVPYVEADYLYAKMDKNGAWDAEENRFAALTDYKIFRCPSCPEGLPVSTVVPAHYVGIAGLGADAAALPQGDAGAGFFGYERQLKIEDIRDHTSMTLMALETARASGAWTAGGPATVRGLDPTGPPYLGRAGQFGGCHRGGANALFADGSVRFLEESIAPDVLEAMATIGRHQGAEAAGGDL